MSSPEHIFYARRVATRNGLMDYGVSVDLAERWCDTWEAQAMEMGIDRTQPDFWTLGDVWIREQRAARKTPPSKE